MTKCLKHKVCEENPNICVCVCVCIQTLYHSSPKEKYAMWHMIEKGIVFAAVDKSITVIWRNHFVPVLMLTQNRLSMPYIGSLTVYKLYVSNARLNFLPFLSTVTFDNKEQSHTKYVCTLQIYISIYGQSFPKLYLQKKLK